MNSRRDTKIYPGLSKAYLGLSYPRPGQAQNKLSVTGLRLQESLAIAKTTARCAQYMGALKSFESPRKRPRLLFQKFVKGFCSDRH